MNAGTWMLTRFTAGSNTMESGNILHLQADNPAKSISTLSL